MTKIDIISGFLGAGKTTFIKKMIDEAFKGEQIVLIENEFGEVGIDGGFLKDAGIQITEMNSGCICCSLVGDFGKNLNEVITKYHPDRILIEPSGVGKLSDVMKSVIDIEKEQPVKLNALVTVVNALKASKQMKAFGEFFNNQIEYATTVILSRSQNATPEQLEFCVKQIQALNPKASVITTDWDAIKGEQILKTMEGQDNLEMKVLAEARHAQDEAEHHHHHDHDEHEHHHDHDEHEHHHDHDDHEHHHDHDEHEHHHVTSEELEQPFSHHHCHNPSCSVSDGHNSWKDIVISALKHTLQVTIIVYLISFVLVAIMELAGEDAITSFLIDNPGVAIFGSALVGLIPNCGASVVITQLYLDGMLGTGAMISGLLVSAGVGILVLFSENHRLRQNIFILLGLLCVGVVWGALFEMAGIQFL